MSYIKVSLIKLIILENFSSFKLGIEKFFELVADAEVEYEKDYRMEYERLREAKKNAEKVSS